MKKHLARFLAMVMIMISIPMNVFADEIDKIISVNTNARQEKVINEDNVIQKTENKTVYELENGLKREVLYDTNVRFYDKNNKLYPLGAIYSKNVLPIIEEMIEKKYYKLSYLIEKSNFVKINIEKTDIPLKVLSNINTLQEYDLFINNESLF